MAGSGVVVVSGGDAAGERTAAALEEAGGPAVTAASVEDAPALDDADVVVCRPGGGWTALELLGVVRERAGSTPVALAVDAGQAERLDPLVGPATAVVEDGADALRERVEDLAASGAGSPGLDGSDGSDTESPVGDGTHTEAPVSDGTCEETPVSDGTCEETPVGDGTCGETPVGDGTCGEALAVLDQLPDPALLATTDTTVQYANPAFEATFGYGAEAVVGRDAETLLLPDDGEDGLVYPPESGGVIERQVRRETADGPREFLLRATRLALDDRSVWLVVYTDVTDRERRARRVDALHGTTREMLAAEDREAVAEVVVEAARDLLRLPASGVHLLDEAGEGLAPVAFTEEVRDLFDGPPPTMTRADERIWDVFETGDPLIVEGAESPIGPKLPVRSLMIHPLGEHGVFISAAEHAREFDEVEVDLGRLLAANAEAALDRAAGEAALRERERALTRERDHLAALFENMPVPAVRSEHVDGRSIVRAVNPAFEEAFGYDAETLVGERLADHLVPEDDVVSHTTVTDRTLSGEPVEREVRRRTADGPRDFLLTVAPVPDPDQPGETAGAFAFYLDVTERKQRQQRLRVLSRVLRHDIRNRMNVIAGHADLVSERTDDPGVGEPAARIRAAAGDLLELSRKTRIAERSITDPDDDPVDVVGVVADHVEELTGRHPAATVETHLPDGPVPVPAAAVLAVEELLDNAVVHHDRADPRVDVRVAAGDEAVRVVVADDGPGIPESELEFVRGDREPTQLDHASGVGLWVVTWIVAGVGGDVSFEDREPRGTEVTVRLPRIDAG